MTQALLPGALLSIALGLTACSDTGEPESASPRTSVEDSGPSSSADMGAPPLDAADDSLLETLSGEPLALGDYGGDHVLLNYWATWCAPCIEEIPSLLNAVAELGPDYHLLLVSDESSEKIREFLADHDFEGNFVRLTRSFSRHGVNAVPSTVLYGPRGQELEQWLGIQTWDAPEMLDAIREAGTSD